MLQLDAQFEDTRKVLEFLASCPELRGFSLIGGTALSLQIGHRQSDDLDFWLPKQSMVGCQIEGLSDAARSVIERIAPRPGIERIADAAKASGFAAQLRMPADDVTRTRVIHGVNLLHYVQEYRISNTKVMFFSRLDAPYQHFNTYKRVDSLPGASFNLMGIDGIFAMKSWLLCSRARSRDLFDLKCCMAYKGKTMHDLIEAGHAADASWQVERAEAVLVGDIPLDADDEGLSPLLGCDPSMVSIYAFFRQAINQYRQGCGEELARGTGHPELLIEPDDDYQGEPSP